MKIGVLALQGGFQAHARMLSKVNQTPVLVKKKEDLEGLSGLILPGGESTTNIKLMEKADLKNDIVDFHKKGAPLFGTCAGLILLAKDIVNSDQFRFGLLDLAVARNAYGTQKESFSQDTPIPIVGEPLYHCIFIRAPQIAKVSEKIEVLASLQDQIIFVKQDNVLGATFHPELTEDTRIHKFFVEMCEKKR